MHGVAFRLRYAWTLVGVLMAASSGLGAEPVPCRRAEAMLRKHVHLAQRLRGGGVDLTMPSDTVAPAQERGGQRLGQGASKVRCAGGNTNPVVWGQQMPKTGGGGREGRDHPPSDTDGEGDEEADEENDALYKKFKTLGFKDTVLPLLINSARKKGYSDPESLIRTFSGNEEPTSAEEETLTGEGTGGEAESGGVGAGGGALKMEKKDAIRAGGKDMQDRGKDATEEASMRVVEVGRGEFFGLQQSQVPS